MSACARRAASLLAALLLWPAACYAAPPPPEPLAGIVTRLPTSHKVVALTFDACQAGVRAELDRGITDFLVARKIPFTVFLGGRFARDNAQALRVLAADPLVEFGNHSWSHPADMRELTEARVRTEVERAQAMIESVTGHRPRLFRFPGGNADTRTVALVGALGLRVVHWRWAEGDPDEAATADRLIAQTLERTRAGDILIFHVNGRGWHTAEALPRIVDGLEARGFRFVPLGESLAGT
jgi:peptidoglycan/xylan/chitin deacetylase (PgdA/CDA1 family)